MAGRRATEIRQHELVDAALRIIATRGIALLTTRRLAEQVGLTTGAIFRHFASLDALLDAVVARVEFVLASTYPSDDRPPRERLERFVEARSTAVGDQVGILRLVLSEQFHLALPKGGSARLAACIKRSREFIHECIRDGQAAGEIRDDIEASALTAIVMGTIQVLALSAADPRHRAADARSVRESLFALLVPPAALRSIPNASKKKRSP